MGKSLPILSACLLAAGIQASWANGGGSMNMPHVESPRERSPEEQAKSLYNDGVKTVKKADKYFEESEQQTDARKKEKAAKEAQALYTRAMEQFGHAAQYDAHMHEAWNYFGYTNRKLGKYDIALAAYERALTLQPGYPDALEYRGEAYLGLNRISDAQQAYLDLFANNRTLADKLLKAMKGWVETQRASSTADTNAIGEFDKWIQERSQIAAQTASLTRAGAAASWR